jgi:hypothetical protein
MMLSPNLDCGRWTTRFQLNFPILALMLSLTLSVRAAAQSCPIESTAIENAKPNKLYLYFPTTDDAAFPATSCTLGTANCFQGTNPVRPLKAFDITNLTDYAGTTSDLEDQITNVVIDDYCEFNVKVLSMNLMNTGTIRLTS